jgi:hypothetical protein
MPDGGLKTLLFSGMFVLLWLISAALFRASAQPGEARAGSDSTLFQP